MKNYLQKNPKEKYSNNWATPEHIYNRFILNGYHDPNPLHSFIDPTTYDYNGKMFINPPYQRGLIEQFIDMAIRNHKKYNKDIVLLIPARTDTQYFHKLLNYGINIEFIKGRLKFGNGKGSAPFPSILIYLIGGKQYDR